ncbi:hypothetical protein [Geobacter sp. DSM 9736]|uniref:hypothetical protein n=1 Tax=Geobacter sp. DSM 9736 TaxID=1277350 RepID=UPI000B50833B|nr:hypothetical protein [Geobacter sp. DSM 9736]SNB46310.1 hypothetical protein SAMN06269301_1759 [Geobacter sp. DSM 9736]
MNRNLKTILTVQGGYYFITGVWPLVSIGTFQAVTGPKNDLWLVRMVGLLAAVIGAELLLMARSGRKQPEVLFLSLGSIGAFAAIDTVYSALGVISPIYLADAAVQAVMALLVLWAWRQ